MLIVDAQIHLWGADSSDRPWPPGGAQRAQKPYPVSKDMALGGMTPGVAGMAGRNPRLRLVIDHLGLRSGTKGEQAFAGLGELCGLARHQNVAVKASALPCYSIEAYPFADVHPHIRRVYDAFGPRRMFWGTDWTRLPCPWRQAVTLFTEELPWLSSSDKEWIMGRAICEWLGWPMPRSA